MNDNNDKVEAKDKKEDEEGVEGEEDEKEEEEEKVEDYDEEKTLNFILEFRDKEGHLQAPIDLNISAMTRIKLSPLLWYNHDIAPKKIKITNTGYTVILSAKWHSERPYLIDGPLLAKYVFSQMHFHWGVNEMVGSEHYVDGCWYNFEDIVLQVKPNPDFTGILTSLPLIKKAGISIRMDTLQPLVKLLRPFSDDYFLYYATLSDGSKITWIVCREPIGIAQEQIAQFRKLQDKQRAAITSNLSPLQEREGRRVFHVNASGRANSTLLWIPRDPLPLTANQVADLAAEQADRRVLERAD